MASGLSANFSRPHEMAANLDDLKYLVFEGMAGKAPRINTTNYHWEVYDNNTKTWVDTGVSAVNGAPGRDGYTPTISVAQGTDGITVTISDGRPSGTTASYYIPNGQDYVLTNADKQEIADLLDDGVPTLVTDWLDDNVTPVGSAVVVDSSLSIAGAAADAKACGDLKRIVNNIVSGNDVDNADTYQSVNGTRITTSNNQFTVFSQSANYGYVDFLPAEIGKIYTFKPKPNIRYYVYNTDVGELNTEYTNITNIVGWQTEEATLTALYPYIVVSYYDTNNTALVAGMEYVHISHEAELPYAKKEELEQFATKQELYAYPSKQELIDYVAIGGKISVDNDYVNGVRIYRNGSQFSVFSQTSNYGYVNFPQVIVDREYTISAPSGYKYYVYNTDADALDVQFTSVKSTDQWESGEITFIPTYPYLCISYYKEDVTAIGTDRIIDIELISDLGEDTKETKINEVKSIAESVKDGLYLGNASIYRVGAGRTYTTINDALTQWATDGYPKAVVYIDNGEYNETVYVEDKNISFIGESRDGVIVRTKTGNYTYPPFKIHHGNVLVANLTAIADHSGNPSFVDGSNGAYAFHIDGGNVGGVVTVRNCTAISHQSCAFGMGTIPNSKIRIEDCTAISFTNANAEALSLGCVLNHLASPNVYPTLSQYETLELVNVKMYSENADKVLVMSRGNNTTTTYKILAIGNVLASGVAEENLVSIPNNPYRLDSMSIGNTDKAINA